MDEIINKVTNSNLEIFDLEDYYEVGNRIQIDISVWLENGFLLREKDFRQALKTHDWAQYSNSFVAINCSTAAILPAWAIVLVSVYAAKYAKKIVKAIKDSGSKVQAQIMDDMVRVRFKYHFDLQLVNILINNQKPNIL